MIIIEIKILLYRNLLINIIIIKCHYVNNVDKKCIIVVFQLNVSNNAEG